MSEKDFNHIKEWLQPKLAERKLTLYKLTTLTEGQLTNASVHRWYKDTFRPTPEKLQLVCKVLSENPILEEGQPPRYEEVTLWEAMQQFTERPR